ncbi:helix-turn-helix transcriptional regulator [Paenibacillus daejeonensis]|uniref:helix-turn-helix transcriptional regulator n=1 Tax=Paenibacillus daejeonensis TaxID=135193 RepID=UPI000363FFDE|nr:YafY family protein [Paenibacillus daejeonensis]
MKKLDYLLSVLWILRSKPVSTAAQIAEQLEMSVRTVYRYIDILCISGVPIISEPGHGGGYKLPESFTAMPLFFDSTELKAISQSVMFARQANYPHADSLERAMSKISQRLLDSHREELQRQSLGLHVVEPSRQDSLQEQLRQLEQAILEQTTVSIHYAKSLTQPIQERSINPYGLLLSGTKWYLIAFCHSRQQERVFRVDRITRLTLSESQFEKPADVDIRFIFERLHHKSEPTGSLVNVRLAGNEELLDQIANHWYLRAYVSERNESELVFNMPPETMNTYMPSLLLSFGRHVRVLEPLALREQLSSIAYDLAHYYGTSELP